MKRINLELDSYVVGFFEISFFLACILFLYVCIDLIFEDRKKVKSKKVDF